MKKKLFQTFILAMILWPVGTEAQPSYSNAIIKKLKAMKKILVSIL